MVEGGAKVDLEVQVDPLEGWVELEGLVEMDLMATVPGMDLEVVMEMEMEGEAEMVLVEGQETEDEERVDLGGLEVQQEEWEELEVWEAVDLTAIAPGTVLVAAMETAMTGRERNPEPEGKENH